jgi:hypothetical protein
MYLLDHCKNGLPIMYDDRTNEMVYKDNRFLFDNLKVAYESGMDRIRLSSNMMMIIRNDMVSFGCLELSHQQCKSIIRTVCNKLQ